MMHKTLAHSYNVGMIHYQKKDDVSYTIGTTVTMELLLNKPSKAKRVYISEKQHRDETYEKLLSLCKKNGIPTITNNQKIFKELSEKDNTMVIGEFEKYEESLPKGNHLVLVSPMNQGNLGTIIRSAAAFEINGIAIIRPAADIYDPKVVRSSMGALFHVPFRYYESIEEYLSKFKENNLYPFMLKAKTTLSNASIKEPYSLIFGNEAKGLPDSFLEFGEPLLIEQSSKVDSLNLDNAVSIGLYIFSKRN